jgi:hypothetical protein
MTSPLDQRPDKPGTSIRMNARLDAMTRTKVDELARRFHQRRAAVVCYIMQWGLSQGQTGRLCQLSRYDDETGDVDRSDLVYAAIIPINWANRSR